MTSLVLPAYNPGNLVPAVWTAIRDFVHSQRESWEIVFVCDGCTDGSDQILQQYIDAANDPRFRLLSYHPNRGKGYAVRQGMQFARGDLRIFTDFDLAYPFDDILRIQDALRAGAEVAIASRDHPQSLLQVPVHALGYIYRRRMQSKVFGAIARGLLQLSEHDTQAGLKGMTAEVVKQIYPHLQCNGFGFDCELLHVCHKSGIEVQELPVCVRYEDGTSTTGGVRAIVRMIRELLAIRRQWTGRNVNWSKVTPALAPRKAA